MPFDLHTDPMAPPRPAARRLSVLHVLSAFPVLSETFVANEIRAMRALGHRALPLALVPHDGPCQPDDLVLQAGTLALAAEPRAAALFGAALRPAGLARALGFVAAQRALPARSLLMAGAQVAAAARRAGATHIHAHFAHAAAATAIVGARLAGITVSFTGHGFDIYGAPSDLAVKLAYADLAVAVCEDMRADLLALAPGARVAMVPCGVDPARFRPAAGRDNGRLLAVGLALAALLLPFGAALPLPAARAEVLLLGAAIALDVALGVPLAWLRVEGRAATDAAVVVLRSALHVAVAAALLLAGWGVAGVLAASAVAALVAALVLLLPRLRAGEVVLAPSGWGRLLAYGLPLTAGGLASFALGAADRWFLIGAVSPEALAHYALAVKVAMVAAFLTQPFEL